MKTQKVQEQTFKDPVCGMTLTEETTAETKQYKGKTYHFCEESCRQQFEEDPEKYLRGQKQT